MAARSLLRAPLFAGVAALALALGIGATCTVFAAVHAVLLKPGAVSEPERVVWLWEANRARGQDEVEVSFPNFRDWRDKAHAFEHLAATTSVLMGTTLLGQGAPQQLPTAPVSGQFFDVLGAHARLGRTITVADEDPKAPPVAVLSDALFHQLGGDPSLLGRTLTLDNTPTTVIGVMPPEFDVPRGAKWWGAMQTTPGDWTWDRTMRVLVGLGRVKQGVSVEAARRDLLDLTGALAQQFPKENAGYSATVEPLLDKALGSARAALWALFAAVLLVLLIACANVANLFLARGSARARELAVRAALGAGRMRLVRELALEAGLLALCGGALGVLLAHWGIAALATLGPRDIPRLETAHVDAAVLACAALATTLTALLCGLYPALRGSTPDLLSSLKAGAPGDAPGQGRLRAALVVAEVALAVVLVSGAGLFLRTFSTLAHLDPGFDPSGIFSARIELDQARYKTGPERLAVFTRALEKLRALPGVESAALVLIRPLSGTVGWDLPYSAPGQTAEEAAQNPYSNYQAVSAGYFSTMRLPVVRGREFVASDDAAAPRVAVVSEALASRVYPGLDPLGRKLRIGKFGGEKNVEATIVGVVKDARYREWRGVRPDLYVPVLQKPEFRTDVVIRSRLAPAALAASLRKIVAELDPVQPVSEEAELSTLVDGELSQPRFNVLLLGGMAALALLLALVGIYGVLSYSVSLRTRELGVRLALGAQKAQVLRLVVGQGARLALIGVLIGIPAAAALATLVRSLLFGVAPTDPLTLGVCAALSIAVASLAALLPALRAARLQPMDALRSE